MPRFVACDGVVLGSYEHVGMWAWGVGMWAGVWACGHGVWACGHGV